MKISFIVPAYNAEKTIEECLISILNLRIEKEILVIDDGSTDKTNKIAKKYADRVIKIENSGPAVARNLGWKNAKYNIVALIDSDVILTKDWLIEIEKNIKEFDLITSSRWLGKNFEGEMKLDIKYFCPPSDFYVIKKNVMKKIGGFSEIFPWPAGEDTDLLVRFLKNGYKCKCILPKYKHIGEDSSKNKKRLIKFWISNFILTIKHLDTKLGWQWLFDKLTLKSLVKNLKKYQSD